MIHVQDQVKFILEKTFVIYKYISTILLCSVPVNAFSSISNTTDCMKMNISLCLSRLWSVHTVPCHVINTFSVNDCSLCFVNFLYLNTDQIELFILSMKQIQINVKIFILWAHVVKLKSVFLNRCFSKTSCSCFFFEFFLKLIYLVYVLFLFYLLMLTTQLFISV